MSKTIETLGRDMVEVGQNPQAMARIMLNSLEERGITIASPVDPIIYSAECSLMSGHAIIAATDNVLPKIYSSMATNWEDLYRHMSDKDTVDLFSQPSKNQFIWSFDLEELRDAAETIEGTETKMIVIPVDTIYQAKDRRYAQPYPIEIRFLSNDWIQVRWDTSVENPITALPANEITWAKRPYSADNIQRTLLTLEVPVEQYEVKHQTSQVLPRIGWKESYIIDDNYFTSRVWYRKDSVWTEMKTHHSIDVIDPLAPTAVITVEGKKITITIPEVYINTNQVSGDIRISIYSTLGAETVNLANYPGTDFTWTYRDHLGVTPAAYYNALKKVETIALLSISTSTGGRAGLSFLEARQRVITNTLGDKTKPITEEQLTAALSDQGYDIHKAVDVITGRIYLASLAIPAPENNFISGAVGTVNDPVVLTISDIDNHPAVRVNGNRWTLTDECLFKQFGGNVSLYPNMTLTQLNYLKPVDRIDYLRDLQLLNLPFHVVLDINNDIVEGRAYAMKKPMVLSRAHLMTNDNLQMEITTSTAEVVKRSDGYRVRVVTRSDDSYKAIPNNQKSAYLSFDIDGVNVYMGGDLVAAMGDEEVWEWNILTNLDIDRNDKLIVDTFRESNGQSYQMAVPLQTNFKVAFVLDGAFDDTDRTDIDDYVPGYSSGVGAGLDNVEIKFGDVLSNLWVNARASAGTIKYKTYEEDVPAVYQQDEIATDPESGGYLYEVVDGVPVFTPEHKKGDPVFNPDGTPKILHAKGSNVFVNGQAVVEVDRGMDLESNLWLVDARYLVTDDPDMVTYNDYWYSHIVNNAINVLPELSKDALEETDIMLTAKNTIARIKCKLGNESVNYIPAEQEFGVDYYVTDAVRQNQELLTQIKTTTDSTIEAYLSNATTISTSDITTLLKAALGDNIKGVEMKAFEDAYETRIFTILDPNARATIAKRLVMSAEGKVELENDVSISYNRYQ